MKAVVALGAAALIAGASFPGSAQQAFEAHILIVRSHAAIEKWALSPPEKRRGDAGRARTIAREKVGRRRVVTQAAFFLNGSHDMEGSSSRVLMYQ